MEEATADTTKNKGTSLPDLPSVVVNPQEEQQQQQQQQQQQLGAANPELDPDLENRRAANAQQQQQQQMASSNGNGNIHSRIVIPKKNSEPLAKSVPGSPNKPPRGERSPNKSPNKPWKASYKSSSKPQEQQQNGVNSAEGTPERKPKQQQPVLMKLSKSLGTSPKKALDYALQAVKFFEESKEDGGKRDLELTMSLHALAAVHCRLRQFNEAIAVLERSLRVPDPTKGLDHELAVFTGQMHIGDTFGLMGKQAESLQAYHTALDLQKKALGERDLRVAQTQRYLAEAHLQNMQFKEAEEMCEQLLRTHAEIGTPGSVEEAADRRLMALICTGKGEHDLALEYLVLASMALISNGHDLDVASVEVSIGDTYVALERYEDAVFAYQKALTVFKSAKGEDHISVASVYVSLADLYLKTGKQREAKTYCESALKLYAKHDVRHPLDEITSGLTEIAALYGAMNEPDRALQLLSKVLDIVETYPGQQHVIAAIEAQMGVLYYVLGKYGEALVTFKSAVMKLRCSAVSEKKAAFLGLLLNQMGLACVELYEIVDAAECFQEARNILEQACGSNHVDTIAVSTNLAATWDALGRLDEAISLMKDIIKVKEEHLGAGNPEVESEKLRLNVLLKEVGQT